MLHRIHAYTFIALVLTATGCQPSASQRLVGTWQGRPETQADKEEQAETQEAENVVHALKTDREHQATLLEQHPFAIALSLKSDSTLEMKLGDQPPLVGTWHVLDSLSPEEARVEIVAHAPSKEQESERRRFLAKFLPNDKGFTLREEGTDPLFGAVHFERK